VGINFLILPNPAVCTTAVQIGAADARFTRHAPYLPVRADPKIIKKTKAEILPRKQVTLTLTLC
jgi:hypothetical protein